MKSVTSAQAATPTNPTDKNMRLPCHETITPLAQSPSSPGRQSGWIASVKKPTAAENEAQSLTFDPSSQGAAAEVAASSSSAKVLSPSGKVLHVCSSNVIIGAGPIINSTILLVNEAFTKVLEVSSAHEIIKEDLIAAFAVHNIHATDVLSKNKPLKKLSFLKMLMMLNRL
jgi:hypothetical protein